MELKGEDKRPVDRPEMTWSKAVEEDMRKLTSHKIWQKIDNSGGDSYEIMSNPRSWELGILNKDDDDDDNNVHI